MMGDVNLMVATMLLANDRIDEALAQAALTRLDRPEITQFAQGIAQSRNEESTGLQQWRERVYPGTPMIAFDQMLTVMAGMMGPMMQGTPWPGMGQMPGMLGNPMSALCTASGPVDDLFVDALLSRDQLMLAMLGVMQPTVTDTDLQQVLQDAVTSRKQELDQLQAWQQAGSTTVPVGTPAVASTAGASVESYDIYFDPKELTIPAGTDVTVTLPNEGVTLHNFSIDALGISVDIGPGETKTVTINAPAGSYEYYCNVPGHREAGMVGTLTVQ
jgi:plastocyanin